MENGCLGSSGMFCFASETGVRGCFRGAGAGIYGKSDMPRPTFERTSAAITTEISGPVSLFGTPLKPMDAPQRLIYSKNNIFFSLILHSNSLGKVIILIFR